MSRTNDMGAMASMLAHELNQPLTALIGYIRGAQRLLARGDETAIQKSLSALDAAAQSALGAGTIVRRLRELVTHGEATLAVQDLPELIEEACALALMDARQLRITKTVDLDPGARHVAVDRIQIRQVLINLLRNAVEAMRELTDRKLTIRTRAGGERAEISIIDTGAGIPPEQQATLFHPFASTKPGGMGVGLSICRIIVEANGGRIWLERSNSGGTEFRFTVPLSDGEE